MSVSNSEVSVQQFYRTDKTFDSNGTVFASGTTQINQLNLINSVSKGDPLPNYRDLIRNGECATTYLTGTRKEVVADRTVMLGKRIFASPPNYIVYSETYGPLLYLGLPASGSAPLDMITSAENSSLTNFYSRLQAVETKFKGLVFLGELRESLKMIRHPVSELRKGVSQYLTHLKRFGKVPKHRRLARVRETWLEYSYGWAPLVSDIDSAIHAFYSSDLVHPIFEMVHGRGMIERIISKTPVATVPVSFGSLKFDRQETANVEVKHYGVYHSTGNGADSSLHHWGIRLNEFVPTLWELIPYSFLVDYFTNVGKILESWSYRTQNLAFLSMGLKTNIWLETVGIEILKPSDSASEKYEVTGTPGFYRYRHRFVERTPHAQHTVPSLELKVPGHWYQWANIAALSGQLSSVRKILNH